MDSEELRHTAVVVVESACGKNETCRLAVKVKKIDHGVLNDFLTTPKIGNYWPRAWSHDLVFGDSLSGSS